MKNKFLPLALVAAMFTGLNSCDDLEALCNLSEDDLGSGEVFVTSLNHMMDVYSRIDNAYKDTTLQNTGSATIDGAECTLTSDSLILDFGNGASCADGKIRKGSIRTGITADYMVAGGGASGNLSGYHVDNVLIVGSLDVMNDGPTGAYPVINVFSNSIAVGDESDVDFDMNMQWLSGFLTMEANDDIFKVYGAIDGADLENNSLFEADIIDSLHYDYACVNYIEYGSLDLTISGDSSSVGVINVDFIESDGCNNLFMVTATCDQGPISFTYPFN